MANKSSKMSLADKAGNAADYALIYQGSDTEKANARYMKDDARDQIKRSLGRVRESQFSDNKMPVKKRTGKRVVKKVAGK